MDPDANTLLLSSIRRLLQAESTQQLVRLVNRSHPADLAHLFNSLTPSERRYVLNTLSEDTARGELLAELEATLLRSVATQIPDDELMRILDAMPSDDAADVMQSLPDGRRDILLAESLDETSEATNLMEYDKESAGGLMVTDFLSLSDETTAAEAVELLQGGADAEIIFYVYVTNDIGQLVGVASLRELVQQPPDALIKDFMIRDVIRVSVEDDQEDVARLVARYNLLALPVVEDDNRLIGVVTVDDIIDVIRTEATEDMLLMAGAGNERELSIHRSPLRSARSRLPWLFPSFMAGAVGILVISVFEEPLSRLIPLAALIPMIMGLSGNVGTQSSTIINRGLALGRLEVSQVGKIVAREVFVGVACGFLYGIVAGAFATLYFEGTGSIDHVDPLRFGTSVGAAVLASTTLAAAIGAGTPIVFKKLGLDPAVATGPFVITSIDVLAVLVYLSISTALLS